MDRKRSAAARRRRNARRAGAGKGEGGVGFATLLLVIVLLGSAVIWRVGGFSGLEALRRDLVDLMRNGGNVKEAVAVLGKSFLSGSGEGESAIEVFGKNILGIEQTEAPQSTEAPDTTGEPDITEEPGEPQQTLPTSQKSQEGAGEFSGLSFTMHALAICESPIPQGADFLTPEPVAPAFDLPPEELEDDTPNEEFCIPSPDSVDNKVYTLRFTRQKPLKAGRITSHFGYRIHPIHGNTTFHYGIDIAAASGTRVSCFAAGTVAETGYSPVFGNYVLVRHADGFSSYYAHMKSVAVKKGDKAKVGGKLGTVGSTGWSTGPHLHFEIRRNGLRLDPLNYVSYA